MSLILLIAVSLGLVACEVDTGSVDPDAKWHQYHTQDRSGFGQSGTGNISAKLRLLSRRTGAG